MDGGGQISAKLKGDRDGLGTIFAIAQEGTGGKKSLFVLKIEFFWL